MRVVNIGELYHKGTNIGAFLCSEARAVMYLWKGQLYRANSRGKDTRLDRGVKLQCERRGKGRTNSVTGTKVGYSKF